MTLETVMQLARTFEAVLCWSEVASDEGLAILLGNAQQLSGGLEGDSVTFAAASRRSRLEATGIQGLEACPIALHW